MSCLEFVARLKILCSGVFCQFIDSLGHAVARFPACSICFLYVLFKLVFWHDAFAAFRGLSLRLFYFSECFFFGGLAWSSLRWMDGVSGRVRNTITRVHVPILVLVTLST